MMGIEVYINFLNDNYLIEVIMKYAITLVKAVTIIPRLIIG